MILILGLLIFVAIVGLITMWRVYMSIGTVIAYGLWSVLIIVSFYLVNA